MSKYEMLTAIFMFATVGGISATLITSWFRFREKALDRTTRAPDGLQEQRMVRIETAIEAIAVEVERISEGQRFTTRLLTERTGVPAPAGGIESHGQQREGQYHGT